MTVVFGVGHVVYRMFPHMPQLKFTTVSFCPNAAGHHGSSYRMRYSPATRVHVVPPSRVLAMPAFSDNAVMSVLSNGLASRPVNGICLFARGLGLAVCVSGVDTRERSMYMRACDSHRRARERACECDASLSRCATCTWMCVGVIKACVCDLRCGKF
jgi:hypothetical protein